jgi:hypothetical protein
VRTLPIVVFVVAACSIPLAAQWPKYQDVGVPRDAQGRVRMDGLWFAIIRPPVRPLDFVVVHGELLNSWSNSRISRSW